MNNTSHYESAVSIFTAITSRKKAEKNKAPHCVNPECPNFNHSDDSDTSWRTDHGSYETKAFGTVPRYRCRLCGKTFSDQSFSMDYYVKLPFDYAVLMQGLMSTTGQGNITRFSNVRYELIQNRYERLARVFLALHARLRSLAVRTEDFALDGFESFSVSQYFPNNVNLIAGSDTEYIYGMGFAQLRRKGAMTNEQKLIRSGLEAMYGKAPPKAVELSVASLLCDLGKYMHEKEIGRRKLFTDEHKAYVRALGRIIDADQYFVHRQVSSKLARSINNPLFPVNYVDRQFRKDMANHVRETVQFARCPTAMMLRLTIYQMYHNYLMPRRVRQQRKGNWQTRGELMGITRTQFLDCLQECWGKRVFYHKCELWEEEKSTWLMKWRNSRIPMGRRVPDYIAA